MFTRIKPIILILLSGLLYSRAADATVFVNTWENLDPINSGLRRMALLFSDNSLVSIAYAIGMAGLSIGALTYFGRISHGARSNPLSIFFPTLIGAVALAAVITPKDTVILFDRVTSQYSIVPDVPAPIATLMSWTSQLETKMIGMIDQSAPPGPPSMWSYSSTAGGANIDIILNLLQSGGEIQDSYFQHTIDMYISNCASWAIGAGALNTSDLKSGNIDLAQELAAAANPAIYTVTYSATNPNGISATCSTAWNSVIKPGLATGRSSPFIRLAEQACNSRGWPTRISSAGSSYGNDSNIPAFSSLLSNYRCLQLVGDMTQLFTGENTTPAVGTGPQASMNFARHVYLSKRMMKWADQGNVGALGSFNQITDSFGGLTMATQWMPAVRGALYGFMYALLPFAFMFSVTGVAFRALFYVLGGIAWLMIWNVMDAMATSFTLEYAYRAFQEVREHQLGLTALALAQPIAVKVMTAFAKMKIGSALFATSFMFIVFRFGGNALTAIASGFQNSSQSYGGDAERKNVAPVEQTAWRDALAKSDATQFAAKSVGGFGNLATSYSVSSGASAIEGSTEASLMGGTSQAAQAIGHSRAASQSGTAAAVQEMGVGAAADGFHGNSRMSLDQGRGTLDALQSTPDADQHVIDAASYNTGHTMGTGETARDLGANGVTVSDNGSPNRQSPAANAGAQVGRVSTTRSIAAADMATLLSSITHEREGSDALRAMFSAREGAQVTVPLSGDEMSAVFSEQGAPSGMTSSDRAFAQEHGGNLTFSVSGSSGGARIVGMSFSRNDGSQINQSSVNDRSANVRQGINTDGMAAAQSDAGIAAMGKQVFQQAMAAVGSDGQVNTGRLQAAMETYTGFLEGQLGIDTNARVTEFGSGGASGEMGFSSGAGSRGLGASGNIGYRGGDTRQENANVSGRGSLAFTQEQAQEIAAAVNAHAHGDPVAARAMLTQGLEQDFRPAAEKWVAGMRGQAELSADYQANDLSQNQAMWQKARELGSRMMESFHETGEETEHMVDMANGQR